MKSFTFLVTLCVLSLPVLALDREAFTFTSYDLEVRVEPAQQRLSARGKITLRNNSSAPQKNLVMQISSSLDWRSIQWNGKPVQFVSQPFTSDIDHTGSLSEAVITLPQEIAPQGTVELEVGYEGLVPFDATRLTRIGVDENAARHSDWDQIGKSFAALRGIGYVAWYPVATEAASLTEGNEVFQTIGRWKGRESATRMNIRLCQAGENASDSVVVTNADSLKADASTPASGCGGVYTFSSLATIAPAFAVAPYIAVNRDSFSIYYLPEHKVGEEDYTLAIDLTTPFVTEWFGAPRGKEQLVDLADAEAAPFESGNILFTPLVHSDARLAQMTVVHQLTHAAFPSSRLWIYEGLAHFAQAAYRENESGRQSALDFLGLHRTALQDAEKAVAAEKRTNSSADESLINTNTEEFYRSKAMFVWWMLRDMLGEAPLKKALTAYHADQDKEPSYMQHLLEAQSKRDLEWFFDGWVYRDRGLPDLKIDSAIPRETVGGGSIYTVTVINTGDVGAEVPVTLRMDGADSTERLQVNAKSKASIRMRAAAPVHEIVVNDGSVPESDLSNNVFKVDAVDR
jgi:aminopeptidase N